MFPKGGERRNESSRQQLERKRFRGGSRAIVLSILSLSRNGDGRQRRGSFDPVSWSLHRALAQRSARAPPDRDSTRVPITRSSRSRARTHAHTGTARDSRASLHATGHVRTQAHKHPPGCKCALNSAQQFSVRDERSHAPIAKGVDILSLVSLYSTLLQLFRA